MSNNIPGIVIIIGVIILVGVIYCLSQDYPVQVSLSLKPCLLGGNICFLGEDLKMNIDYLLIILV
jgi:hypothetical protein